MLHSQKNKPNTFAAEKILHNFIYWQIKMKQILILSFLGLFLVACNTSEVEIKATQKKESPIQSLIDGNQRFVEKLAHDKESHDKFLKNQNGQNPQAIIITCSDSRIPPSVLFQKEIGDLFTIRTAGNIVGDLEMASIEYAVAHLHTPLIVVMGHTHCGAISAFVHHEEAPEHIKILMDSLSKEKEIRTLVNSDSLHKEKEYVMANTLHTAYNISTQSKMVAEKIKKGELSIVPVVYDLETGKVSLLPFKSRL